jgi:hypothetical protein
MSGNDREPMGLEQSILRNASLESLTADNIIQISGDGNTVQIGTSARIVVVDETRPGV